MKQYPFNITPVQLAFAMGVLSTTHRRAEPFLSDRSDPTSYWSCDDGNNYFVAIGENGNLQFWTRYNSDGRNHPYEKRILFILHQNHDIKLNHDLLAWTLE